MNRRVLLRSAVAGMALVMLPDWNRVRAQQATPVPGNGLLNIRWQLDRINSGDRVLVPDDPSRYWVQFQADGKLLIGADCNSAGAVFKLTGSSIGLGEIFTTGVACAPDSISDEFLRKLKYVVSYTIFGDVSDQLVLDMMADGGQLVFTPLLTGVVWQWTEFQSGDGSIFKPTDPTRYTAEFHDDGTVRVLADCNSGSGLATIDGTSIDLTVAATRMACPEGSQSSAFLRYLNEAVTYVIRDGRLALSLPAGAGIALFQPVIPAPEVATPVA